MILTKKDLEEWQESMFTLLTTEQIRVILERFGEEPEPYEWTEQDIAIQIRNYIGCGEFVKTMIDNSNGKRHKLPPGVEF